MVLVPKGASTPIGIIENNGDGGLGNTRLSLLVNKLLEIGSPDLLQIGDAQHEADGVEDVGLSGAVEARDSVEEWVETRDDGPRRVRLETLQANLLYVHFFLPQLQELDTQKLYGLGRRRKSRRRTLSEEENRVNEPVILRDRNRKEPTLSLSLSLSL
ncbi:hypothetical protein PanWU01x14_183050, partial [Parasponia andersonii]